MADSTARREPGDVSLGVPEAGHEPRAAQPPASAQRRDAQSEAAVQRLGQSEPGDEPTRELEAADGLEPQVASGGVPTGRRRPASRRPQLYARPGLFMGRQLGGDLALLVWMAGWAVLARLVKHLVDALAVPVADLARAAQEVSDSSGTAGDTVQKVPGVGGTIASPFHTLQEQVARMAVAAQHQVTTIHHLAWVAALLCWLIPVAGAAWWWVPRRWRFVREAGAARRLLDQGSDLDLFALRAMAHLSLPELAKVSNDPVGDWRAGDQEVIERLATLELRRSGLDIGLRRRSRRRRR